MDNTYSREQLNNFSRDQLVTLLLNQQDQLKQLNASMENMIEQIHLANQRLYGRRTEKMSDIPGQLSFFNEAEETPKSEEPDSDTILPAKPKTQKQKGKRNADLKDFPEEIFDHAIAPDELDEKFGAGNWREMPVEEYKRLRYEPASWTVERHMVHVYVGTDGDCQDEFARGDHPKDLLRNSIATPSLVAAILNAKYVNASPLYRIEQEFNRNGLNLSRQVMADWVIKCSERYFSPFYDLLKEKLLELPVTQADETPVEVIKDDRSPGSKSYMWVHRSGEFFTGKPIVLYEYEKTRKSDHPKEFYKDYHGVLVTDGLSQYHKIDRELEGLTNANCWAHLRRSFADAVKAAGKEAPNSSDPRLTTAYEALSRIATIYKLEGTLKSLPAEERLKKRQSSIQPLVDEYFAWAKKKLLTGTVIKGKTLEGLNYSVNQEKYLRVFLTDGNVPIDNGASERSIKPFTVGRKSWVFIYSLKGADASAVIYSITETAKLNNLNPYYYLKYLLEEIPLRADNQGWINSADLEDLLPWSDSLPEKCYKANR